ncbi:MAG TPA: hypothetical protein VJH94_02720 [Candidatus Paceibacterota bacterium]
MHQLRILEWFGRNWPNYPKDSVFAVNIGTKQGYAIAFETHPLRVLLGAVKGPKGGLYGILIVVDPTQKILIDQLLCSSTQIGTSETLDMLSLWLELKPYAANFDEKCPNHLLRTSQKMKDNPESVRTTADIIGSEPCPVITTKAGN